MKDLFVQKTVVCPACSTSFYNFFLNAKEFRHIKQDADFCKHYEDINPIFYEIMVCPNCYFACEEKNFAGFPVKKIDSDIPPVSPHMKDINFTKVRNFEEALQALQLAIRTEKHSFKRVHKLASYYMKCGWIERYRENQEREDVYSEFALINYEHFYKTSDFKKMGRGRTCYLIGEINRRLGDYKAAEYWFYEAEKSSELEGTMLDMLTKQQELLKSEEKSGHKNRKKGYTIADEIESALQAISPPGKTVKAPEQEHKKGISDGYFSSIKKYGENEIIFFENDMGNDAYIIKEGEVEIYKRGKDNQKKILAVLKAGDVFGEMALIKTKHRTATAWAKKNAVLLAVRFDDFNRLIEFEREFAIRLINVFRERLLVTGHSIIKNKSAAKKTLSREHLYISKHFSEKSHTKDKTISFKAGELIFSEFSRGDVGYIIKSGSVRIAKSLNTSQETTLEILQPGDIFGELALLGEEVRVASAMAEESGTECYVFNKDNFVSMLRKNRDFAVKILKICVSRLEKTTNMLCDG